MRKPIEIRFSDCMPMRGALRELTNRLDYGEIYVSRNGLVGLKGTMSRLIKEALSLEQTHRKELGLVPDKEMLDARAHLLGLISN